MDIVVVEGRYEDGKIELEKQPAGILRSRVRVTFLPELEDRRRMAGERLLTSMRKGLNFGGEKFDREEIYAERMSDLESRRAR